MAQPVLIDPTDLTSILNTLAINNVALRTLFNGGLGSDNIADGSISYADIGFTAWSTYTPALTASTTNPTLGTGSSLTGRYSQIGKNVTGGAHVVFGSAGVVAGTGTYFVSLPVTGTFPTIANLILGSGWLFDSSASLLRLCVCQADTTTRLRMRIDNTTAFDVGAAVPWTWAASDELNINFCYEAA